jgi:peptidoglycan L-alanyl-D-glutamate endopeptidase CwlK
MASRRLEDLTPEAHDMAKRHVLLCAEAGIELLIYCTLRDTHEQARLYRQSRTKEQVQAKIDQLTARGFAALGRILKEVGPQKSGPKVTGAGPGESFHQYSRAYDCVPVVNGKPVWSASGENGKLWAKVGQLGKKCGLEWAGDWTSFREFPHFQLTAGDTVLDLMKRKFGAAPAVGGPAGAVAAAAPMMAAMVMAAAGPESGDLRRALDEASTVFLVFGLQPKVSGKEVRATFDKATRVANGFSPRTWRTFLVQSPGELDQDLAGLVWPGGDTSPAALLGLGTGLDRTRVRGLQLSDLADSFAIADVFSQG